MCAKIPPGSLLKAVWVFSVNIVSSPSHHVVHSHCAETMAVFVGDDATFGDIINHDSPNPPMASSGSPRILSSSLLPFSFLFFLFSEVESQDVAPAALEMAIHYAGFRLVEILLPWPLEHFISGLYFQICQGLTFKTGSTVTKEKKPFIIDHF